MHMVFDMLNGKQQIEEDEKVLAYVGHVHGVRAIMPVEGEPLTLEQLTQITELLKNEGSN